MLRDQGIQCKWCAWYRMGIDGNGRVTGSMNANWDKGIKCIGRVLMDRKRVARVLQEHRAAELME